ncbi:DUF342 domain-containing protein, partial [candidate division KSB1 bacterium]|nr:DUF342 domain-containing protein [candidate division KSB1 bacterium]
MKLELSEDNMQAFLIFQDEDLANPIDKAAIVKLLHEMDITEFNLNEGWQDAYEKFQQKVLEENQYLIAEGTPVIAGKDGWLEYFFETDVRHNLESDEHGQVDFHNLHFVQNVKKGDRLVELHAPTEGTPGKDLFANVVEVEEVKPASLPNCQNAEVSSENPNIIIAKIDGHVRLARSKEIVVEDVVKISGDIDFDTGDIKAIGSVIISGDVKSGFKVEAQGSITIKGCVEDATIISSADVIIKNGFIGHGKGVVHAGGDVITKHVSNQQIVADGKILVNGEIIQGHLLAGESIEAKGHAGNIIGGIIQAGTSVTAHCIGNTTNMRTDVTIGSNTQ